MKAHELKRIHKEELLAQAAVVAVGLRNEKLAIFVKPGAKPKLPSGLDKSQVEYIETSDISALGVPQLTDVLEPQRTGKFRPVPAGVSAAHKDVTAGTTSFIVTDGNTEYSLSNNHVYANINAGSVGDEIWQPGSYDDGTSEDTFAELAGYVPINNGAKLDAAWANPVVEYKNELLELGMPQGKPADPEVNSEVVNTGRTTGVSTGTVQATHADVDVRYGDEIITLEDQFITSPMSEPGDSGSPVVTSSSMRPVGLTFAGSDEVSVHNYITNFISETGLDVVTENGGGGGDGPTATFTAELNPVTQTGRIEGNVIDAETGNPIEGATVTAENLETGETTTKQTGQRGNVGFDGMPTGAYRIVVTAENYEEWSTRVAL